MEQAAIAQTPDTQLEVANASVHRLPQVPQLLTSLPRLRHVPLQLVCPAAQTQLPDPSQLPPEGIVHAPEVRGAALHAVPVP